MSYKGQINRYACNVCGKYITTVDRDEGTTPMMLACRATRNCSGSMFSAMYLVDQTSTPEYEWYKPAKAKGPDKEHVKMGGLLIRRL